MKMANKSLMYEELQECNLYRTNTVNMLLKFLQVVKNEDYKVHYTCYLELYNLKFFTKFCSDITCILYGTHNLYYAETVAIFTFLLTA